MRFLEQGSDIPDELISAVTNGSATFLCGAGVSFRVNLPSFKELTEGLYARLGESPNDEPAERNAIASKEYDRALRSLEKRTHRPGTPSRMRDAVAKLLHTPAIAFPDHLALLQLSRDSDGRPRLLTTTSTHCSSGRRARVGWQTCQAMPACLFHALAANVTTEFCISTEGLPMVR